MADEKTLIYGGFSLEQCARIGSVIYKTPSGQEVEITEIGSFSTLSTSLWKDMKIVGAVTEYVRIEKEPDISNELMINSGSYKSN